VVESDYKTKQQKSDEIIADLRTAQLRAKMHLANFPNDELIKLYKRIIGLQIKFYYLNQKESEPNLKD